jgi:hypothetical protein
MHYRTLWARIFFYGMPILSLYGAKESAFVKNHLVDAKLAAILDEHAAELSQLVRKVHATPMKKHGVWTFDWLPGYYVKYNIDRVRKRNIVARSIEKHKLHHMHAPEKRLYHIKGRPHKLNSLNYVVIIEAVSGRKPKDKRRLDLPVVKQFVQLIEDTGHISTYGANYIIGDGGRISFIDTDGTFSKERSFVGLIRLLARDNLEDYYTKDALAYIHECIAKKMAKLASPKKREASLLLKDLLGKN